MKGRQHAQQLQTTARGPGGISASNKAAIEGWLSKIGDSPLWRTNPVWCTERLLEGWRENENIWPAIPDFVCKVRSYLAGKGVIVPPAAFKPWTNEGLADEATEAKYPRPGIVGVVVDRRSGNAWIAPLAARPEEEKWSVAPTLPFNSEQLQTLLMRLMHALELPRMAAVPERLAFAIDDRLGERASGTSMHIAGLLSVVAAANKKTSTDKNSLLHRVCAMVEPDGSGDELRAVSEIDTKLTAFVREMGQGTLLIRAPGCPEAAKFDNGFDDCWEVASFRDLARRLDRAGLLRVFLEESPLTRNDLGIASERLSLLCEGQHRYADALELAERLKNYPARGDVSAEQVRKLERVTSDLYRHLGYYAEAEKMACRDVERTRALRSASDDDCAQADLFHAAALFDAHRFAEMCRILAPWLRRLTKFPRRFDSKTRAFIYNTLARALVILNRGDWNALFQRSAEIWQERDPSELPRTWGYLGYGLLRHHRLEEAKRVLQQLESRLPLDGFPLWTYAHLKADHERRRGRTWIHPVVEKESGGSKTVGHPFGCYLQATARQNGCGDAVQRFQRARMCFLRDASTGDRANIVCFLADCMQLAEAAWGDDQRLWTDSKKALSTHFRPRKGCALNEHYRRVFQSLGNRPDQATAEEFLAQVPYF
jgi:tetratricopeptide (TPR) repeat protein